MNQIIRHEKWFFLLLLSIMGGWFYMLNTSLPLIGDDMAYCYYYDENSLVERPTSTPISSITQVLPSMWNHYCSVNGRFTSHVLVQMFCGLLGKNVFNVFNTLIFVLFLTITVRFIAQRLSAFHLVLTFLFVLYGISFPGQTMFWLTGSINYLWPITLSLILLYYIVGYKKNKISFIRSLMFFFIGLFVGWMNESISIGFAGGLFFFYLLNKNRFSGYAAIVYIGYVIGSALIIFSPGTFVRATTSGEIATDMNVIQMITMRIVVFAQMMIKLPVILLLVAVLLYSLFNKKNRQSLKSMPMVYITIVTASFLWLLGMDEERIYFGLSVMAFVLLMQLLSHLIIYKRSWIYGTTTLVLVIMSIPQSVCAYKEINEYAGYRISLESIIRKTSRDCIFENLTTPAYSRFVYTMEVSNDRFNFHNRVMSFIFDKNYIQAIPHDIYEQYQKQHFVDGLAKIDCKFDTTVVNDVFVSGNRLIISIKKDYVIHQQIKCRVQYANNEDSLRTHQIIIRWLLGSLGRNTEEKSCFYVKHGDSIYYVLPYDGNEVSFKLPIDNMNKLDYVEINM